MNLQPEVSEAISLAYSIKLDKQVKVCFTGKLPVKPWGLTTILKILCNLEWWLYKWKVLENLYYIRTQIYQKCLNIRCWKHLLSLYNLIFTTHQFQNIFLKSDCKAWMHSIQIVVKTFFTTKIKASFALYVSYISRANSLYASSAPQIIHVWSLPEFLATFLVSLDRTNGCWHFRHVSVW